MRLGLERLRLTPDAFWDLTPVELMVMLGTDAEPAVLGRAGFQALAEQFPDVGPDAERDID